MKHFAHYNRLASVALIPATVYQTSHTSRDCAFKPGCCHSGCAQGIRVSSYKRASKLAHGVWSIVLWFLKVHEFIVIEKAAVATLSVVDEANKTQIRSYIQFLPHETNRNTTSPIYGILVSKETTQSMSMETPDLYHEC